MLPKKIENWSLTSQINLYDPDGTRIELMEAHTIDGQPAPSSTAPPPRTN